MSSVKMVSVSKNNVSAQCETQVKRMIISFKVSHYYNNIINYSKIYKLRNNLNFLSVVVEKYWWRETGIM